MYSGGEFQGKAEGITFTIFFGCILTGIAGGLFLPESSSKAISYDKT